MSQATSPRLFVERIDGITVASFADNSILDDEVIRDLDGQLELLLEGIGPPRVVLNFREVRFMSSAMLAVLVRFGRKMAKLGGKLKLCWLAPDLLEIFRITRFDKMFEVYENEAAALDSF